MLDKKLIISAIPKSYATALFNLAKNIKQLDEIGIELNNFIKIINCNLILKNLVRSPVFTIDQQSKIINVIINKVNFKKLIINFINVVIQNNRLFMINRIIQIYHNLISLEREEIVVEVLSAVKLTKIQINNLKKILKNLIQKNVQLKLLIDPLILGGLCVKVGSKLIDDSLRTKLDNLKSMMKEFN